MACSSSASRESERAFNRRVYEIVQRIPCGMVTTYGAIAHALGDPRKAREVGWALYAKPKEVVAPAHRVVNRDGRLSGGWAFGSPEVQRGLLEAEGVRFLADGHVDLDGHLWWPARCVDGPRQRSLFDPMEDTSGDGAIEGTTQ